MAAEQASSNVIRHRDRLRSLKFSTVEACFSVPMLNLTMPNLPFVIAFMLVALGWAPGWVGLLAALPQAGNAVQPFISGWLQKRFSLMRIMHWAFVFSGAPWLLMPLLRWLPEYRNPFIIGILLVSTIANSVASVAWSAAISELVPSRISGKFFARRNLIFGFWTLITVLAAGFTVDRWEHHFDVFAVIFFAAGSARLLGLVFLNRMVFPASTHQVQSGGASWALMKSVFKDVNYMRFTWFIGIWFFFLNLSLPFQTVYLLDGLHYQMSDIVFLTTLAGVGGLLTLKSWGNLCDRYGSKPVLYVATAMWGIIGLLVWTFTGPRWHFHLPFAYLVTGGLTAGFQLCQFNLMLKLITAERRAHHIAVYLAVTSFLMAMGPVVGGVLLSVLPAEVGKLLGQPFQNYHVLFVVSLLGCAFTPLMLRRVQEDAEAPALAVWRAMRAMRSFNPLVGVASAAEFLFTPRGLTGLARQSWRSLRRQAKAVTDVGEEIVDAAGRVLPK